MAARVLPLLEDGLRSPRDEESPKQSKAAPKQDARVPMGRSTDRALKTSTREKTELPR